MGTQPLYCDPAISIMDVCQIFHFPPEALTNHLGLLQFRCHQSGWYTDSEKEALNECRWDPQNGSEAIKGDRATQNTHVMFLVSIPAGKFKELNLRVERFDAMFRGQLTRGEISKEEYLSLQGYQRTVDNNRANRFAAYLEDETAISPTVILINDREGSCSYNEKTGMLTFDTKSPLYIYDGQHRQKGIEKALSSKGALAEFPVFAVITSKLPKLKEMTQFKVINGTAKGVKTNLVIEIMTAIQTEETEVSVKDAKQIACNHATNAINMREDSPLKGMVILVNTTKPKKSEINVNPDLERQRIIGTQPFMRSLQAIHDYLEANMFPGVRNGTLKTPTSLEERGKKIAEIVVEFWKAVKGQMPGPFESPGDYVLLGGNGINAMHHVLAYLLGDMHKGHRDWIAEEFVTMTCNSEWFTDASQWEKEIGEASHYGGYEGMDKLAALIIESLVPVSMTA
jgi:DGQHR domain-containing protein